MNRNVFNSCAKIAQGLCCADEVLLADCSRNAVRMLWSTSHPSETASEEVSRCIR